MNINAINNQVFQAKMPKTKPNELRVKVLGEVNGYIEKRLADGSAFYEKMARDYGIASLNLAQKGDYLLINAGGPKTTAYNWKKAEIGRDFDLAIVNNIRENSQIREGKSVKNLLK